MQEDEKENLYNLFSMNSKIAVQYALKRICMYQGCKDFQEYQNIYKKPENFSICQKSWTKPCLAVHCNTCSDHENTCYCLECFLKGDHKGHDIVFRPGCMGNCDCGDTNAIKLSGFCSDHQHICGSPDIEQIEERHRKFLVDVLTAATKALIPMIRENQIQDVFTTHVFLIDFFKIGDGYRRIIARCLKENQVIDFIIRNIDEINKKIQTSLASFWGNLMNDEIFANTFVSSVAPKLIDLFKIIQNDHVSQEFDSFLFHVFSSSGKDEMRKHWQELLSPLYHIISEAGSENKLIKMPVFVMESVRYAKTVYIDSKDPEQMDLFVKQIIDNTINDSMLIKSKLIVDSNEAPHAIKLADDSFMSIGLSISQTRCNKYIEHLSRIAKLNEKSDNTINPIEEDYYVPLSNLARYAAIGSLFASGSDNYANVLREAAKVDDMNIDDFIESFLGPFIRYYGALFLESMSEIPRANEFLRSHFYFICFMMDTIPELLLLYKFFQVVLGTVEDKNRLLKNLMRSMTLLEIEDKNYLKPRASAMLFGVAGLIMDRRLLADEEDAKLDILRNLLADKPRAITELPSTDTADRVLKKCTCEIHRGQQVFIQPDSEWNSISVAAPSVMERATIGLKIEQNKKPHFPEAHEDRFGLDLLPVVAAPSFMSLCYLLLDEPIDAFVVTSIISYYLRHQSQNISISSEICEDEAVVINNFNELVELFEKMNDLNSIMTKKVAFDGQPAASMIDKFRSCYNGEEVLKIIEPAKQEDDNDVTEKKQAEERKRRAQEAKARALAAMTVGTENFAVDGDDFEEEEDSGVEVCAVCSKALDENAVMVTYEFKCVALGLADRRESGLIAVTTCPHKFHVDCSGPGRCAICRAPKNSYVPLFPADVEEAEVYRAKHAAEFESTAENSSPNEAPTKNSSPNEAPDGGAEGGEEAPQVEEGEQQETENLFLRFLPRASAALMQRRGLDSAQWLTEVAATVSLYELRLRVSPEGVDACGPGLVQALFRCLHFARAARRKDFAPSSPVMDALFRYIDALAEHLSPGEEEERAARGRELGGLEGGDRVLFERRAAVFAGLLGGRKSFDLPGGLPRPTPTPLPDRFLELYLPEYNVDIWNQSEKLVLSLIDGEQSSSIDASTPNLLIAINGRPATASIVVVPAPGEPQMLPSIYVDELGNSDIDHQRGKDLYLDRKQLQSQFDDFILCKWAT